MSNHLKTRFMAKWRVLSLSLGVTWLMTLVGKGAIFTVPICLYKRAIQAAVFCVPQKEGFSLFSDFTTQIIVLKIFLFFIYLLQLIGPPPKKKKSVLR